MRKILSLLLAAVLLLLALAGCSQAQKEEPLPESIEINFFYNEPCGACHDQINDFYDMFNTQLEDVKDKYPYDLQAYNVFQASASDKMYTVLEGLGYPEELISSLTYPILTINGAADTVVDPASGKTVVEAAQNGASANLIIENCDHTLNMFSGDYTAINQVISATAAYFLTTLGGTATAAQAA